MARISEAEKQETQQRIIEAARSEFSKHGIQHVSIREIARLAGVGASTLYGYFPSKHHLFLSTMLPTLESRQFMADHLMNLDIYGLDLDRVTDALTEVIFTLPSTALNLDRSILREIHVLMFSDEPQALMRTHEQEILDSDVHITLSRFFERLQDAGIMVPEVDPLKLSNLFTDIMRMAIMDYVIRLNLTKEACYDHFKQSIQQILIGKIKAVK